MCLAVPLEITEVFENRTARVTSNGVDLEIDVSMIPDPAPGDFVIVHAGFAIEKLDSDAANETLDLFEELGSVDGET